MEISFDSGSDVLYISLKKGRFSKARRLDKETILDYDSAGSILGMELINVSNRMHAEDIFRVAISMPPYPAN
ncbi:MAG: DUF2283 domain-containing protein [Candidatus Micrarchaeota archaeon]|nr:DUF2283 domain-containing protein [Candidatus Micrarchaeota archaeon]